MKILLEYVWIDGNDTLRSKNKIMSFENNNIDLSDIPLWNFDGSSTFQSTTIKSDIILKPVRVYKNPFIKFMTSYLILCECYNIDLTPHLTNKRHTCFTTYSKCNKDEFLFGIEQEYILFERNKQNLSESGCNLPYMWKEHDNPEIGDQNPYYCSIGGDRNFGREIINKHLQLCLETGIEICGTNAEVMASQWEYQIGVCDALQVSDDLWMSRYILQRITEDYNCFVSFHPKPYKGKWNGSGGHTNVSTKEMRDENGIEYIYNACEKLKNKHLDHMLVYGKHNEERLSGIHETSHIDTFSYGVGDRTCSIRIPINVYNDKCGYLEDRRPASNLDPYLVTEILMKTITDI
jgi:glutamine synthetase